MKNLLYITRKFPPMVGGMEKISFALSKEFPGFVDTTVLSWGKSQRYLPIVFILFFIKTLYIIPKKRIDHVHIGDALLSPLGIFIKFFYRIPTSITVMGLDITFRFPLYQRIIPSLVAHIDAVICISNATRKACIERGISESKCFVIPCGVYLDDFRGRASTYDLERAAGSSLQKARILISVGRLVPRKGVFWFLQNVFPQLPANVHYFIIGEGKDRKKIDKYIHVSGLTSRVHLLGHVSDDVLRTIYHTADLYIMPNIKIPGNMEGFGIVALEASSTGLPVIASKIDGITDSVTEGKNGVLVTPGRSNEWKLHIERMLTTPIPKDKIRSWIKAQYNWQNITKQYVAIMNNARN